MKKEGKKEERPDAYPQPTKADKQLDNQDEFIQPQSDKKNDMMSISKDDAKQINEKENSTT